MENRDWNEFRHLGSIETLTGEKSFVHYQEYLQPSLFVHINFTYTDNLALVNTYRQVIELLGDSFQYHDTGKPIRQREKALGSFSALLLLSSPKFITADLHDMCSGGSWAAGRKPSVTGGIGCAEFSAQLYRAAAATWKKRVDVYAKEIKECGWSPMSHGPYISHFRIRMPTDKFADAQAFSDWVRSLEILHSPALFSAAAGYCMEKYRGYSNQEANEKLGAILSAHPGFEYGKATHAIGNVYSEEHRRIKPQISRISWLNILGKDALLFYPGGQEALYEAAGHLPSLTLHTLPHGFIVQAGPEPGIGDDGRAPEAYCDAASLLEMFLRSFPENAGSTSEYPEWEQHYRARKG